MLALSIILLILNLTNTVLHSIGAYALISLYPTCRHKPQRIYIANLAISEGLINFIEVIRDIPELFSMSSQTKATVDKVREYLLMVSFIGISIVYYLDMMYLTMDRLLNILLSLKYPQYWNETRAKYLLITTWLVGIVITTGMVIVYIFFSFPWEVTFYKYIYPALEFLYIIIAFATYYVIFRKYNKSQVRLSVISLSTANQSTTVRKRNICAEFRKSFFLIPVLLISTYLIFMIIPDMTYLFVAVINNQHSNDLSNACWISYAISNLLDAGIYIYFHDDVRKFLIKKMKITCSQRKPKESMMEMQPIVSLNLR